MAERVALADRPVQVPALMLAAACALWGWHQSALAYAAFAAVAIESARYVRLRWDFSDTDFHRLVDVSGVGLVLLIGVQFGDRGLTGIYGVLRWFPMVLLAVLLGQLYSTRREVKMSALFLSVRLALRRGRISDPGSIDMRLPFLVACMLSAAAGPERSVWVLPAEGLLLAWLLVANRPARRALPVAIGALLACAVSAALALEGAAAVRRALEPLVMDIMRERIGHWRDPFRSYTSLGDLGRLKLSDRIVLRVEAPPGTEVPTLLREASYRHFSNNVWLAGDKRFDALEPRAQGTRWDLAEATTPFRLVTVSKSLIRNKGMLAIPGGSFRVDELPVEEVHASPLGALKVINGPALVRYRVRYAPGGGFDAPPTEGDRIVPPRLAPVLERTLTGLDLGDGTPAEVVAALARHFRDHFAYSLELTAPRLLDDPVSAFLEQTRRGHCEFFATATVLLLRAAGVPARYATGYSVQEFSELEETWVARRRHAHSWALVWLDGRWVDLDTTPSAWVAAEAADTPWWQDGYDFASYLLYAWSRWRLEGSVGDEGDAALMWLLLPLSAVLGWRVYRSRRVRQAWAESRAPVLRAPAAGADSEFYRVEARLRAQGLERPCERPPRGWIDDLVRLGRLPPAAAPALEEIVGLHYRLRFRPGGLAPEQRARLRERVDAWLAASDRQGSGT